MGSCVSVGKKTKQDSPLVFLPTGQEIQIPLGEKKVANEDLKDFL